VRKYSQYRLIYHIAYRIFVLISNIIAMAETKIAAAISMDPSGQYAAELEIPVFVKQAIEKWAKLNILDADLEKDGGVAPKPGGIQAPANLTTLLCLGDQPPSEAVRFALTRYAAPKLSLGQVDVFEGKTGVASDGSGVRSYCTLHVQVLGVPPRSDGCNDLHGLQNTIGVLFGSHDKPIKWHFDKWNPHLTIAFIKPEAAIKFKGAIIPLHRSDEEEMRDAPFTAGKLIFKMVRRRDVAPIVVPLHQCN